MADQKSATGSEDPRVSAALADYLQRVDRGEPVSVDDFLAQHAEIAGELRSLLVTSEELANLLPAGPVSPPGPEVSTRSVAEQNVETVAPQRVQKGASAETLLQRLPDTFGRYRIIRPLGSGAMGDVYLAEDSQLHRKVALKTPNFDADETGELLERFYREARSAAVLRHSNICPVFDVGEINGRHYISMAYIEGQPLSAYIRPDKPQPERQALAVIRKLAHALQDAHDHGIIHRDLKPGNVMIDRKGEPIVMDFGLARPVQSEAGARLTQSGMLVGSPAYMSPEQVEGDPSILTPSTDQYSLGVMLYELLTGNLPFRGGVTAVIAAILTKQPTPPGQLRADLDPRIEALCLKMMSKSPGDRFKSLRDVADTISTILKSDPVRPAARSTTKAAAVAETAPVPKAKRTPTAADAAAPAAVAAVSITASNVESLLDAANKCMRKHDYEQVVSMLDAIPERKRTDQVRALLAKAQELSDEVAFLLSEIDEALRLNDSEALDKKADALLKLKPKHHKALQIKEELSRYGKGRVWQAGGWTPDGRRIGEGSWIPWLPLSIGACVFGISLLCVMLYLRVGDAVVRVRINHPDVEVGIQDRTLNIRSATQDIKVEPGEDTLKVAFQGADFETQKFTLNKGENPAIVIELLDKTLSAKFGDLSIGEWPVEAKPDGVLEAEQPPAVRVEPPPTEAARAENELTLVAGPDGWIDLLPNLLPDNRNGQWTLSDRGGLSCSNAPGKFCDVSFPADPAGSYEFELGVIFHAAEIAHLHFPAGAGQASLKLKRRGGDAVSFETGSASNSPATKSLSASLPAEVEHIVSGRVDVQGARVRLSGEFNGTQLPDVEGEAENMQAGNRRPREGIWLHVGTGNTATFTRLRYRPLDQAETAGDSGWTDLFNGRDLTGWSIHRSNGQQPATPWAADSDRKVIIARAGGHSWLETEQTCSDFTLSLEWRFPPGASVAVNGSGIVVRADGLNAINYDPKGIEIDVLNTVQSGNQRGTGGLVTYDTPVQHREGASPSRGNGMIGPMVAPEVYSDGQWNKCEIICQGDRLTVEMNGRVVNEATSVPLRAGRICLRNQNTDIEFRNVRIRAMEGPNAQGRSTTVSTLQGSWKAVAQEISGGAWTNEEIEKHEKSITFTDDRFEIRYLDRMGNLQVESGTYRLEPMHEPAHIDMKGKNRDGRDIEFVGIIQVIGNELRHCFVKTSDNPAAARPTSFSTTGGQFSTTYRRDGATSGTVWADLFNGRDLTGWRIAGDATWSVNNGVLTGAPGDGWIATDRDFSDFELQFEYRLAPGANSGLFLRIPEQGALNGGDFLEVQLIDEELQAIKETWQRTGAVYAVQGPSAPVNAPAGQWHPMSIRAQGSEITVSLAGREINRVNLKTAPLLGPPKRDLHRQQGHIGFQHRLHPAEFRNIRIKELAAVPDTTHAGVYELRAYTCNPGRLTDLNARFRDHTLGLFARHGIDSVAYFTPIEGARAGNTLVYFLRHENKEASAAAFEAFAADPEWVRVRTESEQSGPILSQPISSTFLKLTDFSPGFSKVHDDSVYELRTETVAEGKLAALQARYRDHSRRLFEKHGMENVAFFVPVDAPKSTETFIYLLAHKSRDAARESWRSFGSDPEWKAIREATEKDGALVSKVDILFLTPTEYSPGK